MHMVLRCDCGFKAAGETEDELVAAAQAHAGEAHGTDVAAEVVRGLLHCRPSGEGPVTGHGPPGPAGGPGRR